MEHCATEELLLDTGLGEYEFGKTNLARLVTEFGVLARAEDIGARKFSFEKWRFDETRAIGDGDNASVFFRGECNAGQTLLSLLGARSDNAAFVVCAAISSAIERGETLPQVGAGGIYVSDDFARVLFLPQELFERTSACMGPEFFARAQGVWRSAALSRPKESLAFIRASIAYAALAGSAPYGKTDETERDADELDKNYAPIECVVNGIDEALARAIDGALDLPHLAQKKNAPPSLEFPRMDMDVLRRGLSARNSVRAGALPDPEFRAKAEEERKSREKRVKAGRTARRNAALILGSCAAAVAVALVVFFSIRGRGELPTTRGLDSSETVELFYKGIHTQDAPLMNCASKGKAAAGYSDMTSQVYVAGKMRGAYMAGGGTVSPEEWCAAQSLSPQPIRAGMFGLTNFSLDGEPRALDVEAPKKRDKKNSPSREDGETVADGKKKARAAEYFVVQFVGADGEIECERHVDVVTVAFKKNRWLVVDINDSAEQVKVDTAKFRADFDKAFARKEESPGQIFARLKSEYEWLPRAEDFARALDDARKF